MRPNFLGNTVAATEFPGDNISCDTGWPCSSCSVRVRARVCTVRMNTFARSHRSVEMMEPQAKKARLSLSKTNRKTPKKKVSVLPDGIYDKEITFPPGIANIANNCYASSVLQCLFSHSTFRGVISDATGNHSDECTICSAVTGSYHT